MRPRRPLPPPPLPRRLRCRARLGRRGLEYSVRVVPGDAKAGEDAKSVIEVTAAPGFHMNAEFPSRVKALNCTGATLAKAELGPEDAEVTEQVLRFTVPFKADAAGQVSLAGAADFSVCNDRTCKLIRDEKVAWAVEVK
ncbi:MAG: hypothetical protein R3F43_20540 [bacterium]